MIIQRQSQLFLEAGFFLKGTEYLKTGSSRSRKGLERLTAMARSRGRWLLGSSGRPIPPSDPVPIPFHLTPENVWKLVISFQSIKGGHLHPCLSLPLEGDYFNGQFFSLDLGLIDGICLSQSRSSLVYPWSSSVEGDTGSNQPKCLWHPKKFAAHAWQFSIHVWLLLDRSSCSSPSVKVLHCVPT